MIYTTNGSTDLGVSDQTETVPVLHNLQCTNGSTDLEVFDQTETLRVLRNLQHPLCLHSTQLLPSEETAHCRLHTMAQLVPTCIRCFNIHKKQPVWWATLLQWQAHTNATVYSRGHFLLCKLHGCCGFLCQVEVQSFGGPHFCCR